jgi:hypothetical protein
VKKRGKGKERVRRSRCVVQRRSGIIVSVAGDPNREDTRQPEQEKEKEPGELAKARWSAARSQRETERKRAGERERETSAARQSIQSRAARAKPSPRSSFSDCYYTDNQEKGESQRRVELKSSARTRRTRTLCSARPCHSGNAAAEGRTLPGETRGG